MSAAAQRLTSDACCWRVIDMRGGRTKYSPKPSIESASVMQSSVFTSSLAGSWFSLLLLSLVLLLLLFELWPPPPPLLAPVLLILLLLSLSLLLLLLLLLLFTSLLALVPWSFLLPPVHKYGLKSNKMAWAFPGSANRPLYLLDDAAAIIANIPV